MARKREVKQIILQIHEYKQTLPDGQAWLEKARAHYADDNVIQSDFSALLRTDFGRAVPCIGRCGAAHPHIGDRMPA